MATDYKHLQQRGRSEADLLAEDEVPLERELVVAADTGRTWVGDGISPLSALPVFVLMDAATEQLPDEVRATIAANLADPSTPEGAALAEAIAASGGGGGGGSSPLTYDATTGLYTVPDGSSLTYDSASGLYSTN